MMSGELLSDVSGAQAQALAVSTSRTADGLDARASRRYLRDPFQIEDRDSSVLILHHRRILYSSEYLAMMTSRQKRVAGYEGEMI